MQKWYSKVFFIRFYGRKIVLGVFLSIPGGILCWSDGHARIVPHFFQKNSKTLLNAFKTNFRREYQKNVFFPNTTLDKAQDRT